MATAPVIDQVHGSCVPYTTSTITFTTDAATPANALMVLVAGTDYASSSDAVQSPGSKWTQMSSTAQGGYEYGKIYAATALSEGGSETVSVSFTSDSENGAVLWVIPDAEIDVVATDGNYSNSHLSPSVTTTQFNDLLLCSWMIAAGDTYTPQSGMTEDFQHTESGGYMTVLAAHEDLGDNSIGATGTRSCSPTGNNWIAFTVAVNSTAGPSTPETHDLSSNISLDLNESAASSKSVSFTSQPQLVLGTNTVSEKTTELSPENIEISVNDPSTSVVKSASSSVTANLSISTVIQLIKEKQESNIDLRVITGPITGGWIARDPVSEWSVDTDVPISGWEVDSLTSNERKASTLQAGLDATFPTANIWMAQGSLTGWKADEITE